ncbi:MAG: hypothetical protein EOP84_25955, partial [Verrucomicrobiaceae bacterium]
MNQMPVQDSNLPPGGETQKPVRWRRRTRVLATLGLLLVSLGVLVSPLAESRSQGELRRALTNAGSLFEPSAHGTTGTTATLELKQSKGVPKAIDGLKVEMAIAAPDRLWISTQVDRQPIELGRKGNQIWIWQPAKGFGVVGEPGVPRFAAAPEASRDTTQLEPLALPFNRLLLPILPRLFSVEKGESEEINGERCHALRAK